MMKLTDKLQYKTSTLTLFVLGIFTLICRLLSGTLLNSQLFFQSANVEIEVLQGDISGYPASLQRLMLIFRISDLLGRIAFPIFAYLIVRQILISTDISRYISVLALSAAGSELLFDYLYYYSLASFLRQNMLLTILLGVVAIVAMERYYQNKWVRILISIAAIALAHFANLEEGAFGISLILLFYLFRDQKPAMIGLGVLMTMYTITGPLAFIPIAFHNQETTKERSPFLFIIYPALLIMLVIIRTLFVRFVWL